MSLAEATAQEGFQLIRFKLIGKPIYNFFEGLKGAREFPTNPI